MKVAVCTICHRFKCYDRASGDQWCRYCDNLQWGREPNPKLGPLFWIGGIAVALIAVVLFFFLWGMTPS